jgi:agmatine/peptidylarginine deiminase
VPVPYFGDGKYRTYVNGLALGTEFVAPSYADVPKEIESRAYRVLSTAMPGTNVVAVPADDMIALFGSVHCISLGLALRR